MSTDAICCQIKAIADYAIACEDEEISRVLSALRQVDDRLMEELTDRANSRAYWAAKLSKRTDSNTEPPGAA